MEKQQQRGMTYAELQEVLKETNKTHTVEHDGTEYYLRCPELREATTIHAELSTWTEKDGLKVVASAIEKTYEEEKNREEDTGAIGTTHEHAMAIVLATGGYESTVGQKALSLCGVPIKEGDKEREVKQQLKEAGERSRKQLENLEKIGKHIREQFRWVTEDATKIAQALKAASFRIPEFEIPSLEVPKIPDQLRANYPWHSEIQKAEIPDLKNVVSIHTVMERSQQAILGQTTILIKETRETNKGIRAVEEQSRRTARMGGWMLVVAVCSLLVTAVNMNLHGTAATKEKKQRVGNDTYWSITNKNKLGDTEVRSLGGYIQAERKRGYPRQSNNR